MLPVSTNVLGEWDLHVNEDKTEFLHFSLANPDSVDSDGKLLCGYEPWRFNKSLGSLLCSTDDMKHRIVLANSAFLTYSKVWLQGSKIPLAKKLFIYEAQVISVLLYICGCWSAQRLYYPNWIPAQGNILGGYSLLNIHLPNGVIVNRELYLRCQTLPITDRVIYR